MMLLLLLAAAPALSEIRSDQALAPVVFGAAPARQVSARVASDGTNFFVVWRTRSALNTGIIGGSRLSPAGELLDRPGILISSGASNSDVVFVGGNYLVVYQQGSLILSRRISRDGQFVDPQPLVVSVSGSLVSLSTNGKTVLLATTGNQFQMLTANGFAVGRVRAFSDHPYSLISVVSNGDRYLVAYTSGSFDILDANGDLLFSRELPIPDRFFPERITATSNGSSFLIVMATAGPVRFSMVDANGNASELRTIDNQFSSGIVATWTGSEYTLVWARTLSTLTAVTGHDIVATRIDAAGVPLDTYPVTIASARDIHNGMAFASAWNGRDTIIITGDNNGGYYDWHTTAAIFESLPQIDLEPPNRRQVAIASSAAEQAGGALASNGTLSLVTWRESSGLDQAVVRAAFIGVDGQLGAPIDLGPADAETTTATASNGRDFLVAYVDTLFRLVARRVTLEGVFDSTPIVITPYGVPTDSLAAGWSGHAYVVATTGQSAVTISGVAPDGTVTVSRQAIGTDVPADSPAVSCGANGCGVTWHWVSPICFFPECSYTENDVIAGTDPTGNIVSQVLLTDNNRVTPARPLPASDGRFIFIYSNWKWMYAGRITGGGVVLDTPALNGGTRIITSETQFALEPVAVANGGLYFVEPDNYTSGRLYWTRIEPEPTPHVTTIFSLHQSVTLPLTLTASARNTYYLYSRGEDDPSLMAARLFLRTLASPDPQPAPIRKHVTR